MTTTAHRRQTREDRRALGKAAREHAPLESHAEWSPAPGRTDPIASLSEQDATRVPDLVPVRHGRMHVSPFTFYRGAAKIMAEDLASTPNAGLTVQLCGDAHLSNFGVFASPERNLVFDLNDFDETLPGPFEYDVKRLAASFEIAARNNAFSVADTASAVLEVGRAYRAAMAQFATMGVLDTWYARMSEADLLATISASARRGSGKREKRMLDNTRRLLDKAHTRDSMHALTKLAELVDRQYRIVHQPPTVVPSRVLSEMLGQDMDAIVAQQLLSYRGTLQSDRQKLIERYEMVDIALKVVGVGSVGTRAFIVLMQGRDEDDPLFLQVKEANRSVLEGHLPRSEFPNHGQRVVHGQRMMQAVSDIFLGWTDGLESDRSYYWRQLRDMKGSADVEVMAPEGLGIYARTCAWTLARAHARSGDPVAICGYLGKSARFDRAIAEFARRYADQNQADYAVFDAAIRSGALESLDGV